MFDFQTQLTDYGHYLLLKTRDKVWDKIVGSYESIWKVGTTAGQVLNKYLIWKKVFVQAAWFIYLSFVSVTSGTWNQSVLLKDQSTNHCTIEQCEPKFAESYKRQDLRKASSLYLKSFLNKHNKSSIKSWAEEGTDPQWLVGKMSKYKEQFPNMQVKKIWEKVLLNNPSMDLKRQKNFKTEQSYKQMQVLYIYIYIYIYKHTLTLTSQAQVISLS